MARPKGTTSEVQKARKVLQKAETLSDKVYDDIMKAYQTIIEVMQDKDAVAATRRTAAMDIIALFNKLHSEAALRIEEFEKLHSGESEAPDEEEDDSDSPNNVSPIFKFQ